VAIDDHVGARIRERRIMLGLTQQQLAEMIGVTYQQAHKYQRGINRVSAGRLFEIARALSAPITYFYEGIGEEGPRQITLTPKRVRSKVGRSGRGRGVTGVRSPEHRLRGGKLRYAVAHLASEQPSQA